MRCDLRGCIVVIPIIPLRSRSGLDEAAIEVMSEAFEAACKVLPDTGLPGGAYARMARAIVEVARAGERDFTRLRDAALRALSKTGCSVEIRRSDQEAAQMASIIPFLPRGIFDDVATKAMGEAFDAACKALHYGGQPEEVVQNALARRIVAAARKGERDPTRLRLMALAGLVGSRHASEE
jgi:hypothetical protein